MGKLYYCLGPGFISLESMQSRGHYVGVEQNGQPVIKNKTGIHTKFWVIIDQPVSLKTYNCRAVQLIDNHDY